MNGEGGVDHIIASNDPEDRARGRLEFRWRRFP